MDMAGGYIKAVEERLPGVQIVFDRFHVQRLASDALDTVRREQLRELRGSESGRELFRSRFALLKNPWNLTRKEQQKLSDVQRTNAPLYRAYRRTCSRRPSRRPWTTSSRRGPSALSGSGWPGPHAPSPRPSSRPPGRSASTSIGSSPTYASA